MVAASCVAAVGVLVSGSNGPKPKLNIPEQNSMNSIPPMGVHNELKTSRIRLKISVEKVEKE